MKFLFVPDLHIGKGTSIGKDPIGVGLNSRVEDQKNLLEYVGKIAKDYQADEIILMGDIWEEVNPKSSLVKIFFEWVRKIIDCGLTIRIVMGNHDFVRSGHDRISMLDSLDALNLPNCHVYRDIKSVVSGRTYLTFMPFTDRKQMQKATIEEAIEELHRSIVAEFNDAPSDKQLMKIVVGHMAIDGSLWVGDELDEESNEIFVPRQIFKDRYHLVLMGHIHKYQAFPMDGTNIIHVGSLDKTSFTDGSKFIIFYDDEREHIRNVPLPCRNLIDLDVSLPVSDKDATAFLLGEISKLDNLKEAIVRIRIKINAHDVEPVDKDAIEAKLKELGAFHLCSFNEVCDVNKIVVKSTEIDETIDHFQAVDLFVKTLNSNEQFKKLLAEACKSIIKECQKNEV